MSSDKNEESESCGLKNEETIPKSPPLNYIELLAFIKTIIKSHPHPHGRIPLGAALAPWGRLNSALGVSPQATNWRRHWYASPTKMGPACKITCRKDPREETIFMGIHMKKTYKNLQVEIELSEFLKYSKIVIHYSIFFGVLHTYTYNLMGDIYQLTTI